MIYDDVELGETMNLRSQQNWTIRYFLYIAKIIFEKLNHFPIILISLLFVSSSKSGFLSEYNCILISAISSGLINLIFYLMK